MLLVCSKMGFTSPEWKTLLRRNREFMDGQQVRARAICFAVHVNRKTLDIGI